MFLIYNFIPIITQTPIRICENDESEENNKTYPMNKPPPFPLSTTKEFYLKKIEKIGNLLWCLKSVLGVWPLLFLFTYPTVARRMHHKIFSNNILHHPSNLALPSYHNFRPSATTFVTSMNEC